MLLKFGTVFLSDSLPSIIPCAPYLYLFQLHWALRLWFEGALHWSALWRSKNMSHIVLVLYHGVEAVTTSFRHPNLTANAQASIWYGSKVASSFMCTFNCLVHIWLSGNQMKGNVLYIFCGYALALFILVLDPVSNGKGNIKQLSASSCFCT